MVALAAILAPRSSANMVAAPTFSDAAGIHVESVTRLSARQYNVTVLSRALGRPVDVRILVPADYDRQPTRLPVLYLFHGTSGRASDWVHSGDAERATDGLPLIVVMPDAGFNGNGGGWFTNWVNTTTVLGASQWETFHVGQLIPWVDANLRTIGTREGRGIAGLSQGGFGSTTYAARHPDLFVSAASFSGAPDVDYNPIVAAGATAVIEATAVGLDGVAPGAMFGSRATNEINWQGHDPATLVTNLRAVDLWLFTATGAPGPYDPVAPNPGAAGIESLTHGSTISFVQRAQQLGVPVHLHDYTYGTHTWPYWARDLREYLGPLMNTFAHPPAPPVAVSYQSIDESWSHWGWSVAIRRSAVQQFSQLSAARRDGFTISGTGTASVTTPAFYPPGSVSSVTIANTLGRNVTIAVADATGRLHLTVPLGLDLPAVGSVAVMGIPSAPATGAGTTVRIAPA
ncbi:MAG: esterase family protein [Acidimicrobiales bacterium]|nr:esterase family protein [Acidimicrobiales bacterium]